MPENQNEESLGLQVQRIQDNGPLNLSPNTRGRMQKTQDGVLSRGRARGGSRASVMPLSRISDMSLMTGRSQLPASKRSGLVMTQGSLC